MYDISAKLAEYSKIFDNNFRAAIPYNDDDYQQVVSAMMYSLTNGGKRIRPAILMAFYELCGKKDGAAVNFAVALEMIHTYSLIHDDLPCMDDDDLRRGKPSCHKAYGEDIAVLAGDGLLTEAFAFAGSTTGISSDNVVKALRYLAQFSGVSGMIGGQVIDINNENCDPDVDKLQKMYSLKTGALLKAAASIGCILADREDLVVYAEKYAENIGLAFQITDDILDIISDSEILGKPIHSDEKNHKVTFVSLYGIQRCRQIVDELTSKAKDALEYFNADDRFLSGLADHLASRKN